MFVVGRVDGRPTGSTGWVQERWAFTSAWAAGVIVRVIVDNDIDKARAAAEQLVQERSGGLILSVAQFDGPPPRWDEATPIT